VNRRILNACLVVVPVAISAAACGGSGPTQHSQPSAGTTPSASPSRLPSGSWLVASIPQTVSTAVEANGALYYVQQAAVGEHVGEEYAINRLDLKTGRTTAVRRVGEDPPAAMLVVAGSLWVTTSDGNDAALWRLDPETLAVRARTEMPRGRATDGVAGSLAYAGGSLWIGSGTLDRVSTRTARVETTITLPHPGGLQVAADSAGRVLLASFGYGKHTYLARLDPATGRTIKQTRGEASLALPAVAGIVDGGAWVQNTTAGGVSVRRLDIGTLKFSQTAPWAVPSSRVRVRVDDGVLWVIESQSQNTISYCADPATGKALEHPLTLRGDSVFLTANSGRFYFSDVPLNAHAVRIGSAPISRACRASR